MWARAALAAAAIVLIGVFPSGEYEKPQLVLIDDAGVRIERKETAVLQRIELHKREDHAGLMMDETMNRRVINVHDNSRPEASNLDYARGRRIW